MLLRAGTLTGWLGSCAQTKDAQESANNLITESAELFEALSAEKKVLEGRTELAYCYWREGSYDEARIVLKGVLERVTTDSELKAKAVLRSAIVENNLGFLFFKANRFEEAHEHLGRARRIFSALKDLGSVAQVDDTRARALLAQGRNEEAEKAARAAVAAREKGGRQSLLAEALTTHGTALARLALHDYARQALFRATEVAYQSVAPAHLRYGSRQNLGKSIFAPVAVDYCLALRSGDSAG